MKNGEFWLGNAFYWSRRANIHSWSQLLRLVWGERINFARAKEVTSPIKRKSPIARLHVQPPISARAVSGCTCSHFARMHVLHVLHVQHLLAQWLHVQIARATFCTCCWENGCMCRPGAHCTCSSLHEVVAARAKPCVLLLFIFLFLLPLTE